MPRLPDHVPFTMIPNFILDEKLESLSEGELKLLLTIYRKTVGFDKRSDKIPYSQFLEHTGLSKSTISKGIKALTNKKLVKVDRSENINRYTYCLPKIDTPDSSKFEPQLVQNSNQQPVRNSNTQKKLDTQTEINTTSTGNLSEEIWQVATYWNEIFPNTLDFSNNWIIKHIEKAVHSFTVKQLKDAIFRRSTCSYYRKVKPDLLNKPSSFFPYHQTIANDLQRDPVGIYNYDKMIDLVTSSNWTTDDFEKVQEIKDESDRPMWKLKNINTNQIYT